MKKISIALCTFNGSRFLSHQLDSILLQNRQPDEMIVCDDCSTDQTLQILYKFSNIAPFPLKILINKKNLKPTKNFERAISICSGDYIALSDQDDYWHPNKLLIFENYLDKKENIGAVFSDAKIVDLDMNFLGYTAWEKSNFTIDEQRKVFNTNPLQVLLKHYVVTGSTLMFRSEFRPYLIPIPEIWFHDAWIALVIASISALSFVREPLIDYRQHSANHLGGLRKSMVQQIQEARSVDRFKILELEIRRYHELYQRILTAGAHKQSDVISLITEKIAHLNRRLSMPCNRMLRIPFIAREILSKGYSKYSRNWGSIALDMLL